MLYVGKCRDCGFLVFSEDCLTFKSNMAHHRNKSHRATYEFVAGVSLKDFKDEFYIDRIRDQETVKLMLSVVSNSGFWKAIRCFPELQQSLFSA